MPSIFEHNYTYRISFLAYLLNASIFLEHIHRLWIVEVNTYVFLKSHFKGFLPFL